MTVQAGHQDARRVAVGARQSFVAATAQLDNGTPVVSVMGEVDLATAPVLEETLFDLADTGAGDVVVDLNGCSFFSSAGLRALIAAGKRLERSDRSLALVLSNPTVMRIFQITRYDQLFEIHPSLRTLGTATATATATAMASSQRVVAEMVPIEHELTERIVRTVVFLAPPAALAVGGWLAWGGALHWQDLLVLAIFYALTGLGVTVGYHRLFTHRSFKTSRPVRALLAVCGSMAVEGPLTEWVATHRKHHSFSDEPGDPHSPHTDDAPGWRGAVRGLGHAHVGWMLRGKDKANPARYARDVLADPDLRFISRTFPLWAVVGLVLPFGLGFALTGSLAGALTALLWGGAVRVFLLHHVTFSINSLCHFFGRRPFSTDDQSRNLAWLAPLAFGEAWHNNHHAFPTSARHGLSRWQVDPGAWLISTLERCHLAWDVVRIAPERLERNR